MAPIKHCTRGGADSAAGKTCPARVLHSLETRRRQPRQQPRHLRWHTHQSPQSAPADKPLRPNRRQIDRRKQNRQRHQDRSSSRPPPQTRTQSSSIPDTADSAYTHKARSASAQHSCAHSQPHTPAARRRHHQQQARQHRPPRRPRQPQKHRGKDKPQRHAMRRAIFCHLVRSLTPTTLSCLAPQQLKRRPHHLIHRDLHQPFFSLGVPRMVSPADSMPQHPRARPIRPIRAGSVGP